jgi:ribosomal subunit interface protein
MQTHWAYHNCGDSLKSEIQDYAKKKLSRLQRLLARFRPSLRELFLTVNRARQATGDHFEVHVVLQLPSHTLASRELAGSWWEAVDIAFDAMVRQVRRHKARLRGDWLYRRKNRPRQGLSAAGPEPSQNGEQLRRNLPYQLLAVTP